MTNEKEQKSSLYSHFSKGLDSAKERGPRWDASADLSNRILMSIESQSAGATHFRLDDFLSGVFGESWQPTLAAWASVGMVLVGCLYMSKKQLLILNEKGEEQSPLLVRKSNLVLPRVPHKGLDEIFPSTFAQNNSSRRSKSNHGNQDALTSDMENEASQGTIAAKTTNSVENIPTSRMAQVQPFSHHRDQDLSFNASKVVPGISNQASHPSMTSHLATDEFEHRTTPVPEPTPGQQKWVVIKNNRINPTKNEKMTFLVRMDKPGKLTIQIYSSQGELLRTVVDGQVSRGVSELTWDGTNEHGQVLASGIYFINIETPSRSDQYKGAILK